MASLGINAVLDGVSNLYELELEKEIAEGAGSEE
jgi:hypothetical protein